MNVRRLRKVVKVILEHGKALDMERWHGSKKTAEAYQAGFNDTASTLTDLHRSIEQQSTWDSPIAEATARREVKKLIENPAFYCNTNHCFAGFANLAFVDLVDPRDESELNAASILDLDEDQQRRLFFVANWGSPYRNRYLRATKQDKPKVLAEYVEFFIKEEKASQHQHTGA